MRVFISYASEDRAIAEKIAVVLAQEGHHVLRDASELRAGDGFHHKLRALIESAELFVFLISPDSVTAGRYTASELKFAQDKWRNPRDRILGVMVRATAAERIPAYLSALHVLEPSGNVAAEVAAEVSRIVGARNKKWLRRAALCLVLIVAVAVPAIYFALRTDDGPVCEDIADRYAPSFLAANVDDVFAAADCCEQRFDNGAFRYHCQNDRAMAVMEVRQGKDGVWSLRRLDDEPLKPRSSRRDRGSE